MTEFDISFENLQNVMDWFESLPGTLNDALFNASQDLADELQATVQDKLSGEVLQVKTGALRDSVTNEVGQDDDGVTAIVSAGDGLAYAAIQEYGGQTKAHIIEAVNAKTLSFPFGGKQAFFARVNHPGSDIPARSYLNSSLEDMSGDIVDGMGDAVDLIIS